MKTKMDYLLRFTFFCLAFFAGNVLAVAEANSAPVQGLSATALEKTEAATTFAQRFEIYSETTARPGQKTMVHQSRLRSNFNLTNSPLESFSLYVGVGLDRELGAPREQWVQNSWRPQIGLAWQPSGFVTLWAEYNQRYYAENNDEDWSKTQNDPRAGLALSRDVLLAQETSHALAIENYAEAISYFRAKRDPVLSAHARPVYKIQLSPQFSFDPYAEVYLQRTPSQDLAINTNQLRTGLRLKYQEAAYHAALYGYWPKEIDQVKDFDGQFVGLFVFGGSF